MSSTNRGTVRADKDDYPTPKWCVHRLLEACELPVGIWVEPCAGAGNIIQAVNEKKVAFGVRDPLEILKVEWHANELNPKYEAQLRQTKSVSKVTIGDVRAYTPPPDARVVITNPPFSISEEVLTRFISFQPKDKQKGFCTIVLLQRLNWCAGPRAGLFRHLRPSVFVLPERPSFRDSFHEDPKTGKMRMSSADSIEYGWFVFDGQGRFVILDATADAVRAREKAERRATSGMPLESKSLDTSTALQ